MNTPQGAPTAHERSAFRAMKRRLQDFRRAAYASLHSRAG